MPTYNAAAVSDAVIAFRKPITLQQGRALRDNPLAVAEGATSAPRVQGIALGGISMGAVTVSGTGGQGWIDCDGMGLILINVAGTLTGTAQVLRASYSSDNGATYGSWQAVFTGPGGAGVSGAFSGWMRVSLQTGGYQFGAGHARDPAGTTANDLLSGSGTHTVPADCNAFQLSWSTSGPSMLADAMCLGGIE